jgi:hypothetical protein
MRKDTQPVAPVGMPLLQLYTAQHVSGTLIANALFRSPNGTDKCYGWCTSALDDGAVRNLGT